MIRRHPIRSSKWVNLQLTCVSQNGRSRASDTLEPCALPTLSALAVLYKRRWVLVPARYRLFQPLDDLLGALRALAGQGSAYQNTLHRLGHIQPGATQQGIERHDAMGKEPGDHRVTAMTCQIIPDENYAQWRIAVA